MIVILLEMAEQSNLVLFFQRLTWQDWATALGVLFGILSLIAYIEQRRATKNQNVFVEFAKRNVDKQVTEEQLRELATQKLSMERQVAQAIPALARSAVLGEQLAVHARALAEHYQRWVTISEELKSTNQQQADIDPAIRAAIEDKLIPSHEAAQRRDDLKTRLTILGVASGLAATALPSPADYLVQGVVAIPLFITLASLINLSASPIWLKRLGFLMMATYLGIVFAGCVLGYILLSKSNVTGFGRITGVAMAILSIACVITSPWVWRWINNVTANFGAPNKRLQRTVGAAG
jgi:hypothetical protein